MCTTLYPITTAILSTPLQTSTLEDIPTGIPHTTTGATHTDTHHDSATPNITPLIAISVAPGNPQPLPIDCTQGRHQSHIHGQRPAIGPSDTTRSLFRTCSQIPPQNWMII